MTLRPGLVIAALFFCVYGALALVVNLPKATYGFKSDEATYYMMGLSLVHDHDLTYRKEDLVRVWREFSSGPVGVFLKKGRKIGGGPDPDQARYFYGKSFIYPLCAAPLILLFGTNGFLLLNAICLTVVLLCAYLFLHARAGAWPSAILAAGFVMASVVPVYFVQMMPEVFNFSLACTAYFCWLYKEVASPARSPKGTAWLFTPRSDLACAVLLGIATFSKPTNALLFIAPVLFRLKAEATGTNGKQAEPTETSGKQAEPTGTSGKQAEPIPQNPVASAFRRNVTAVVAFVAVAGGLFALNTAVSGEWNYQGGERRSYIVEFPFQTEGTRNQLGVEKSRETAMTHVVLNPRTFASNLTHNLEYFFVGRYAGMLGYFFPGFFAMLVFLAAARRRPLWQWLVFASALAQGLIFVFATPYTWSGGGVGNRYFFAGYAVMIYLLPPIESIAAALVPWTIGALFVAPMVLNPFVASFRPNENAKSGPLRRLPVELTLLNDLPVWTEGGDRARVWLGDTGHGDPGFLVSFLDDNAYGAEADKSFWTRGDSQAELVIKVDQPIRRAIFTLAAGAVPVDVRIRLGSRRYDVHVDAGGTQQITANMPAGIIYEKEVEGVHLWLAAITTKGGFTPIFYDPGSSDSRYLGVRIKPMLESKPAQ